MNQQTFYIAYASEGGNAQSLAEDFAKRCEASCLDTKLCTLNELKSQPFAKSTLICFVSTTGNGDLPLNGRQFLNDLKKVQNDIALLQFALFALGSNSYTNFCGAGKTVQDTLTRHGAQSLMQPIYADEHFHAPYEKWALTLLSGITKLSETQLLDKLDDFARKPKAEYKLVHRVGLTSEGTGQKTEHLVFEAVDAGFNFQPGDVVSIQPPNDKNRIDSLIGTLKLPASTKISYYSEEVSLFDYLENQVEITKIGAELIKKSGALLNDWDLLSKGSDENQVSQITKQYDVESWFKKYPIPIDKVQDWLSALTIKSPRFYSVANAPDEHQQLHLCVGLQKQNITTEANPAGQAYGLGSGYLCHSLELESSVEFELESHPNFYMQSKQEMIWVATGTGIAPFIGFLAKLMNIFPSERPKVTLYFGVRHPEQDFLYKSFLETCQAKGLIDLKMAFSRQGDDKVYVQDLLKDNLEGVSKSLAGSAHIYVCGSLPMWDAVETILQHAIVANSESIEVAKAHWDQFTAEALHKEIY